MTILNKTGLLLGLGLFALFVWDLYLYHRPRKENSENNMYPKYLRLAGLIVLLAIGSLVVIFSTQKAIAPSDTASDNGEQKIQPVPSEVGRILPITHADARIMKKPFGIYITEKTSPVQPERFAGYHTGTDFEVTTDEQNIAVGFYAICDGKILTKRFVSGYGGVMVQSCTINNQAVTIIYGHVSLKSISKNAGDGLIAGEPIGNLGQYPSETDGERKHLHLGIHIGTTINILGYVQKQADLVNWLDWQKL